MTDDELKCRVAIQNRLGAIAQAGDARKADDYAGCFTADGVLELSGEIGRMEGREAIRSWMSAPSVFTQRSGGSAGFISHHITSTNITMTGPETAKGRVYFLVTSTTGVDHNGYYDDCYQLENRAWLIAHRRPRTLWISPASVLNG
jgi:hypothetical protein